MGEVAKDDSTSLHVKEICSKEKHAYQSKIPSFERVY